MGKVNIHLKRSFLCSVGVIAALNLLMLGSAIFAHANIHYDEKTEETTLWLNVSCVFCTTTLVLAFFGGFGSLKEKKWPLIVFAVGMSAGFLSFVALEVHAQVIKTQMEDHIRSHFLDLLPLTNASQDDLKMLNNAQMQFQCCGVEQGYLDWKNNISQTCLCHNMSINPCVPAPKGSFQFTVEGPEDQPIMIYSKMLPIGLCIAILCQINKKLETPEVVYSKEARAGKYSCLVETPDDYIA
ncbi:tetraspanin-8-like isoform X2 [Cyprinodon tularosa]|uniref:tetraspanin-8-like isoform X2 n=1 Tax=Cyprinodon tularosa TaxID=77115 RepID=UPI0018E26D06|nr:tetraspanin-8-like isoform X2 [Cyprinodon tularosa]